ncbi:uncharacterized protein [Littorina saxatilis]|uniref:uncharacterized protein isoform X2 n=1 Tax=Littorina saxatilis TaxID=31220 RepID=UPI0038B61E8C
MEAFDMATFDDRDFKHIFNFLLQYKWVHDLHLTKFLESRVWEKIPDDWNELFSAMTLEELNCLPFHKADSQPKEPANSPVPESLMAFLQKSSALSHDRRHAKNGLPHPTKVSRDLSKGMSPKKLHEVEWMASLVNQMAVEAECNVVVDVGSGLGYLGQVLHKNYGLRVIGLESSAGHSEGAEKRAAKQGLSCSGVRSIPFLITDEEDNVQEFCSTVRHIAASFHPCEHSPSFQPSRSVTTDNATRVGQPCQPLSNKPETSEPTRCENKVMAGGDRRRCECDSVKHGVTGGTEHGSAESCACKMCYQSSRVNCECGETRSATSLGSCEEETARTGELKFKQTSTEVRDNSETRSATSVGSGEEEATRTGELKFKQTSTEVRDNSETKSAVNLGSGEEEATRTGEHTFDRNSTEDDNKTKSAFKLDSGKEETKRTDECNFEQSSKVKDNNTSQILAGSRSHNVSDVMQRGGISDNNPQAPDASHSLCFSSYSNTDNINNSNLQTTDDTGCHNFSSRTNKDDGVGNDKSSVQARDTPGSPNYSSRMDEDSGDGKNNSSVLATDETGCTNFSSRMDKDDGDGKKRSVPARDVQGLSVCLIGLHCCGDLTPAILRLYHRVDFLRAICCVSCCYHKMKLQPDCDQFINFPMSAAAKKSYKTVCADRKPASPSCPSFPPQVQPAATIPAPTTFLSPCSLRLAAQETRTRWASQKQADHDSHARHVGYRATLELFFGEGRQPGQDRKSVRRLDYNNFNHFVESYLASANICDVSASDTTASVGVDNPVGQAAMADRTRPVCCRHAHL